MTKKSKTRGQDRSQHLDLIWTRSMKLNRTENNTQHEQETNVRLCLSISKTISSEIPHLCFKHIVIIKYCYNPIQCSNHILTQTSYPTFKCRKMIQNKNKQKYYIAYNISSILILRPVVNRYDVREKCACNTLSCSIVVHMESTIWIFDSGETMYHFFETGNKIF